MVEQAKITYSDGAEGRFFSEDGRWFFEHQLPERNARTKPMRYERGFLKTVAQRSRSVTSIEFTQTEA